ncbi:unnamed protein product, partial [marine sediment metagenome]
EITVSAKKEVTKDDTIDRGTVTNITSYTEICEVLQNNRKMIKNVVYGFEDHVGKLFKNYRIYINYADSVDLRLKALLLHKRIIFYNQDPEHQSESPMFFPLSVYLGEIRKRDLKLSRKIVSEITVPIMYKAKIVFGLVQINAEYPLTMNNVGIIKKIAAELEKKIRFLPLPFEDKTNMQVIEINFDEIHMEFRDRKLLRHFPIGGVVFFKLRNKEEEIGQFSAIVKTRNNYGGKTTVSCLFEEKDALSEINLETHLEKISRKKAKQ